MTGNRMLKCLCITVGLSAACSQGWAQDAFMGEYEGACHVDQAQTTKASAKVIAEGPNYYRVVILAEPLVAGAPAAQFEIYGVRQGNQVNLFGRANAEMWHGTIAGDRLVADPGYYGLSVELKKTTRTSPTEGAPPPAGAVVLRNIVNSAAVSAQSSTARVKRRNWANSSSAGVISGTPRCWPGRSIRNQCNMDFGS